MFKKIYRDCSCNEVLNPAKKTIFQFRIGRPQGAIPIHDVMNIWKFCSANPLASTV